jgi:hypothetical protein
MRARADGRSGRSGILAAPLKDNSNRAIGKRARQRTDPCEGGRPKGFEAFDLVVVTFASKHLSALRVPGIERAAELVVVSEEAVHLVDKQRRVVPVHHPEHGG